MPTNCSNDDLKPLAACRDLTQLQLTSDQITDAGVEHLKGLTQLKTIMLRSTAMSAEEINAWRAALPNCQIVTPTIRPANGFVDGPGGYRSQPAGCAADRRQAPSAPR